MEINSIGKCVAGRELPLGACFAYTRKSGETILALKAVFKDRQNRSAESDVYVGIILGPRSDQGLPDKLSHVELDDVGYVFEYLGAQIVPAPTLSALTSKGPAGEARAGLINVDAESSRLWIDATDYVDLRSSEILRTHNFMPGVWFSRWTVVCEQFGKPVEVFNFQQLA
jgi:hypothetical protein